MPTIFLSYSHDDLTHKGWVSRLAARLAEAGLTVIFDGTHLRYGDDVYFFMEDAVRKADAILMVCTPNYVRRANERQSGVGAETSLITPNFYERHSGKRFIPLLRARAENQRCTPDYLRALFYADFTDDTHFQAAFAELLAQLVASSPDIKEQPSKQEAATLECITPPFTGEMLLEIRGSRWCGWTESLHIRKNTREEAYAVLEALTAAKLDLLPETTFLVGLNLICPILGGRTNRCLKTGSYPAEKGSECIWTTLRIQLIHDPYTVARTLGGLPKGLFCGGIYAPPDLWKERFGRFEHLVREHCVIRHRPRRRDNNLPDSTKPVILPIQSIGIVGIGSRKRGSTHFAQRGRRRSFV